MPKPTERRMIPRWRSAELTVAANQQQKDQSKVVTPAAVIQRTEALATQFAEQPTIGLAVDLLSADRWDDMHPILLPAARYLVQQPTGSIPTPLLGVARRIANDPVANPEQGDNATERLGGEIASLRARLRVNPRDTLGRVDLAREFTIQGKLAAAEREMSIALQLAPHSRFVLRSASRFFAHCGEHERAMRLLLRTARTQDDPWLMATLISVESILDESKSASRGLRMLKEGRHSHQDISELACSLSHLEMQRGLYKSSRRLLNMGLVSPNDNAVAQALWVADHTGFEIHTQEKWLRGKFASEARYYQRCDATDFRSAILEAMEWGQDEPFSARPLIGASYLSGLLGDYQQAVVYARDGLRREPRDGVLRNNLAYALMSLGEIEAGSIELSKAVREEVAASESGRPGPHCTANVAMLCFRTGDFERGERLYRLAAKYYESTRLGGAEPAASAMAHMAREAMLAGAPRALEIRNEVHDYLKKNPFPSAELIFQQATGETETPRESSTRTPRVASGTTWRHDRERNVLIIENAQPFKS